MIVEALLIFIASITGYNKKETPSNADAKQIQSAGISTQPNANPCNGWGGGYYKN